MSRRRKTAQYGSGSDRGSCRKHCEDPDRPEWRQRTRTREEEGNRRRGRFQEHGHPRKLTDFLLFGRHFGQLYLSKLSPKFRVIFFKGRSRRVGKKEGNGAAGTRDVFESFCLILGGGGGFLFVFGLRSPLCCFLAVLQSVTRLEELG